MEWAKQRQKQNRNETVWDGDEKSKDEDVVRDQVYADARKHRHATKTWACGPDRLSEDPPKNGKEDLPWLFAAVVDSGRVLRR
ncbi:uncharacterized protein SPSK_01315 [Sporothrix schenckii 1099-18]|uniref:Uncharacterized protein n=1 Tax=Sporothrix schenckii 1099-18 TaxID=1397361 RepID=A0A0F2LY51_SPOSC|nr:uncharacterized protein SPSK_01315 [Sporothrix schenckii 1099-18]KJR81415.1 hypothetical protein SPSK_01315 [Sporothrix schenckii 1099-18]